MLSQTRVLLLFTLCIFLVSCGGKSKKDLSSKEKGYKYASIKDGVLHLDLDKSRKDSTRLNLSDICDSLIYIPLETKKELLLSNMLNELCIDGDDLFIHIGWGVYHFKTDGEFVCQIGKIGRGPGECVCTGICLNKELKHVYVRANYKNKLLEYDYDGKLISERIKLKDRQREMLYLPAKKSLFYTTSFILAQRKGITPKYITLSEYDLDGKLKYSKLSNYFPNKFFDGGKGIRVVSNGSSKYVLDNSIYFQEIASDTVFKKEDDSLIPHIILNNKDFKKAFTSVNLQSLRKICHSYVCNDYFPAIVCGESSRFVFVDSHYEPTYVYDKSDRKLSCVKKYVKHEEDEFGVKKAKKYMYFNDLDGMNHIVSTRLVNSEYLYSIVSVADLMEQLENLKESNNGKAKYVKQLEKIVGGLTEESNPVFMLARLKK